MTETDENEMTPEQKHQHDIETASARQQRAGLSDNQLMEMALGTLLLLAGGGTKYGLSPADAATATECMHRAQPSAGW